MNSNFVYSFEALCSKLQILVIKDVATPLWAKCEDETHTPKGGNLESAWTPATSELDMTHSQVPG